MNTKLMGMFKVSLYYFGANILSTILFKIICLTIMVFQRPEMYFKSFQLDLSAYDDVFMILAYIAWLICMSLLMCNEGYADYCNEKKLNPLTFVTLIGMTAVVLFFTSMKSGFTALNGGVLYYAFYPFGCLDFLTNDFFISSVIVAVVSLLVLSGSYFLGKVFVVRDYPDFRLQK